MAEHGQRLDLFEVSFDDIAKGNDQLRHPSELLEDRGLYLAVVLASGSLARLLE